MNYLTDYTIYTPQLKSGDNKPLRLNHALGNFTYDFDPKALHKFGLNAVSFCFFILWEPGLTGDLNPEIWLKKEISIPGSGYINLKDTSCFDAKFFDQEPLCEVRKKQAFFTRYDLNASYMVIRDLHQNFDLTPDQKVVIRVVYDEAAGKLLKTPIGLSEFQDLLVQNSNQKMVIQKPLHYYETDLEKYLQETCKKTGALFPGDCDMLLYDDQFVCRYIIEFKKTTYRDNTPIQDQSFLNHMDRDRNKYTRLNILRNYFSHKDDSPVPFVTVFYSVKPEYQIKLERIGPNLDLEQSSVFQIGPDPAANQELLLEQIIALCS